VNTLKPLQDARAALLTLGKPVHYGDSLDKDSSGYVRLPQDPAFFVLHLVTGSPNFEWGATTYGVARIQVSAWAVIEGEAQAMLAASAPHLIAARFTPNLIAALGRTTSGGAAQAWTGAAQTWERTE